MSTVYSLTGHRLVVIHRNVIMDHINILYLYCT